ncbi:MAG TPA: nitroreductase family protein [Candidatus Babeliales bacterium]|jgi:nitroreductase|nr:nitroreductase family protein [Candidatus Babeliales bacterium]
MVRKAMYPINDIFINRWSPRAMSGEDMHHDELMTLFEAARWAPSSFNGQPWRFVYAHRNTADWERLYSLLVPANQVWAKNAAVLLVIVSRNSFEYNNKPERTHSFDTGSAWMSLALQASMMNFVAHGMEGFNADQARKDLHIPDDYTVEAMVAIGHPGPLDVLPSELQKKEEPSDRKKVEEFIFEGTFPVNK